MLSRGLYELSSVPDDENLGKSEGFIRKNEKFKHKLDRISRFIRQLVCGKYFCDAQIFSVSRNKETMLA